MFKKLKDKIAEEVKSSPQRIQQLTQTVTEKIHTATSEDSFFSIGEDDATSATPEPGFSNVSLSNYSTPQGARVRKNSNSSIASDVSFLPRYESATNLYHLQSDLDVSASEVEDNASTSSQLGHLSKEQIYAAFQKSQMRYHKYRGRYTDIANHYRELERENGKMKSVLVETQDKALRRVAELREQCSLEQKAKAHLENALRLEIDEKQYIIDTLKTKVDLLQGQTADEKLVNVDEPPPTLAKDLKDAQTEIENLNERLQEYKANAIVFGSKEADFKNKIRELEEVIKQRAAEHADVLERERENNLIIAQTKMELHTEIQNRDLEIENLKRDVEALKTDLDQYESKSKNTKLENLQSQNTKLIEKIESLSQKCKNYESELLKLEQVKIENLNKIEELGEKHRLEIEAHRDSTKQHLLTLEAKIREKVEDEYRVKEEGLQSEFEEKLRQLAANTCNFQEIQVKLLEKEDEVKVLTGRLDELGAQLQTQRDRYNELETNHLELIDENRVNASRLKGALKERDELEGEVGAKVRLEAKISELEQRVKELGESNEKLQQEHASDNNVREELAKTKLAFQKKLKEQKAKFHNDIQSLNGEILDFKEKNDVIQSCIDEYKEKLNEYETAEAQKSARLQELTVENEDLKTQVDRLSQSLAGMEEGVTEKEQQLRVENDSLQKEIERLSKKEAESKTQIEKFTEEVGRLSQSLTEKGVENDTLRKEIEQLSEKEAEIEKFAEEVGRLSQNLTEKGVENDSLRKEVERLSQNRTEKEQQLGAENNTLMKEVERLSSQEEKFTEELERLSQNRTELGTENDSLKKEVERLSQDQTEKEQQLGSLKKEVERLSHDVTEKEAQLEEALGWKEEVERLSQKEAERKSEIERLTREVERLSQTEKELERLKGNLTDSKSLIEVLKEEGRVQRERIATLENYESQFKDERIKLVEEHAHLITCNEELQRQVDSAKAAEGEHSKLIEDKANLERELAQLRAKVQENFAFEEQALRNHSKSLEEIAELQRRNNELTTDYNHVAQENEGLLQEIAAVRLELNEKEDKKLKTQVRALEDRCESLAKENKALGAQVRELEHQYTELAHERQLLQDEVQELKISPINVNNNSENNESGEFKTLQAEHEKEINHLNEKIIQYKSLDLTNRTSIEFYENELQKLKNKNEKLNRKLDETLVTLNHCTELTTSTETEYLRNVLYNYMLGKESLVLARVIAAVCKFDDNQTEAILQREQQKQTLLGQLGFR